MKRILIAAALVLAAVPAMAQYSGGSSTQAGGPLAGAQRGMGAPGGQPASMGVPSRKKMMRHSRKHRAMHRRHRGM